MNTFRIELDLDYQFITTTIRDIQGWFGIDLPELTLVSMIKKYPYILGEMSEVGLDTTGREEVIQCLLNFIGIEDSWPTYGASNIYKSNFYAELRDKLDEFGIPNSI